MGRGPRAFVVDNNPIEADGLEQYLSRDSEAPLTFAGTSSSNQLDLPERVRASKAAVVLIDVYLGLHNQLHALSAEESGIEACRSIRDRLGEQLTLILMSQFFIDELTARKAGADAFILKDIAPRIAARAATIHHVNRHPGHPSVVTPEESIESLCLTPGERSLRLEFRQRRHGSVRLQALPFAYLHYLALGRLNWNDACFKPGETPEYWTVCRAKAWQECATRTAWRNRSELEATRMNAWRAEINRLCKPFLRRPLILCDRGGAARKRRAAWLSRDVTADMIEIR